MMTQLVNRSVFVIRYKEPFLEWVRALDEDGEEYADMIKDNISVYLVPEDEQGEQETPPLEDFYERIFEHQLIGWHRIEEDWPQERSFEVFKEWFDVQGHSVVTDLSEEPLFSEEFPL